MTSDLTDYSTFQPLTSTTGFGRSQFCCVAIAGADFPLFAGEQRDVVVLPEHGQNFFAAFALVDLQSHEERQALAGILQRHMRHGVSSSLAFGVVG